MPPVKRSPSEAGPDPPPAPEPDEVDDLDFVEGWYFAVGGLQTQQARIEINRAIELRRLKNYPSSDELRAGLRDLATAGLMANYDEVVIQHELVFDSNYFEAYEQIVRTAGLVMAALRIRTGADVFCPAVCDRSWSLIQGLTNESCRAYRVEQVMPGHPLGKSCLITPEDLAWVGQTLGPLIALMDDDSVATAVEALSSYLHAGNYRMMAVQLWVGLESLFDVEYEVSYQIAALTARLLERRGPECRSLFKEVKRLYTERSKVVHGRKVDDAKLRDHVAKVRALLARLLSRLVELGKLPDKEDLMFLPDDQ